MIRIIRDGYIREIVRQLEVVAKICGERVLLSGGADWQDVDATLHNCIIRLWKESSKKVVGYRLPSEGSWVGYPENTAPDLCRE